MIQLSPALIATMGTIERWLTIVSDALVAVDSRSRTAKPPGAEDASRS